MSIAPVFFRPRLPMLKPNAELQSSKRVVARQCSPVTFGRSIVDSEVIAFHRFFGSPRAVTCRSQVAVAQLTSAAHHRQSA